MKGKSMRRPIAVVLLAGLAGCAAPAGSRDTAPATIAAPRFGPGGPDADEFGASAGYPIGQPVTFFQIPYLVGSLSHLDQLFESRTIRRAATPSPLARAALEPTIRYLYRLRWLSLDDYLARNPTTGLLIAHGDTLLAERYQYGRTDRHRFASWSMAKTVTAMLIGIAIAEGRIGSVDDPAATYVPGLAGTEYGTTSIRHLLQMSSGVRFVENYSGRDDVSKLFADTLGQRSPGGVDAVTPYNDRTRPAGTKFSYASVETQVLGLVLRAAVGRPVADYLHEKIWEPIGAEADATWLLDKAGQEATYCCLNAVLRDYARLGMLLANDGQWRGREVIPAAWVREATTPAAGQRHLHPEVATRFYGYGYQTWILPGDRRQFAFLGIRGQMILVDVPSRLVLVHTAVRKLPSDPAGAETVWLFKSLVHTLGD